jgi:hypothetical protein
MEESVVIILHTKHSMWKCYKSPPLIIYIVGGIVARNYCDLKFEVLLMFVSELQSLDFLYLEFLHVLLNPLRYRLFFFVRLK